MNSEKSINRKRPVIGVFVNKKFLQKKKLVLFARKLYQANEQVDCTIYFFSLEGIDWKGQVITGFIPDGKKNWYTQPMPFPDILYDRGAGFAEGDKTAAEALRSRFKKRTEILFINSGKLSKWRLHQKLSGHQSVRRFLPATTVSTGINDIRAMVAKHGYVFLKQSGGSGGKSVFALQKTERGYHYFYYRKGQHKKRLVSSLNNLHTEMEKIGLRPDSVIVQQGIQLITFKQRPLDLRVLIVKNREGNWNAVYNQARVAQRGAVITNVSLGGDVMNYNALYPSLLRKYPRIPSDKKIRKIAVMIAQTIEKEFGPFGEIGMDIGVDENGRVWLLEANSKPSKLPEPGLEDTDGISPQFLMILEYAKMLYNKKTRK